MNKKSIVITIVVAVVVGLGGFFGGMQYQKTKSPAANFSRSGSGQFSGRMPSSNEQQDQSGAARMSRGGQNGAAFENGQITAKDDKSITLKTRDGSSKIVYYSDSTTVGKTVDGSSSDLAVGDNVMVNGSTDTTGTITATNIQIRPAAPAAPANQNQGQ